MDATTQVLPGGAVGGPAALGVVREHDLHGVALAAADQAEIESRIHQLAAGELAQRQDVASKLAYSSPSDVRSWPVRRVM